MRIISGKYRNRNLKTAGHYRPTTDRVRETLFNILQSDLHGCVFVDAFAGSGAVGIEALSRGARMVYFLESHRKALEVLESNLLLCKDGAAWRIYSVPVPRALEEVRRSEPAVDFVFYDPPYDFGGYTRLLENAVQLFPEALHILETSVRSTYDTPESAALVKDRSIGETRLAFFTANPRPVQS